MTDTFTFDFFGSIERRANATPNEVALKSVSPAGGEVHTWRRFVDETRVMSAHLIAQGVRPGDRVAILMENHPRWGVAFAAIQSAGAIAVPLDHLSPAASLAPVVAHCEARFLIASKQLADIAGQIPETTPSLEYVVSD